MTCMKLKRGMINSMKSNIKTGILTFNDTNNFGSLLQTYALYKVVSEKYSDCEIVNYRCKELYDREIPKPITRLRSIRDIYRYIRYHRRQQKKYSKLCAFAEKNMKISPVLDRNSISDYSAKYDMVMVGSDIVWGLDITGEDYTYFLDFCNVKKCAYASSFGSDYILSDDRREKAGELLKQFDMIAVREEDACGIVEKISGKKAETVLDPTLLLDRKAWKKHISPRREAKPYILTYFEDEKGVVRNTALKLSEKLGLPVYNISSGKPMKGVNNIAVYSLEDFLSYIYYADLVVTASYHGMAFSVNFGKDFYYFNRCHKSRMDTLADLMGIKDRELFVGKDIDYSSMDHGAVDEKLEIWRKKSYDYLDRVFEYEK